MMRSFRQQSGGVLTPCIGMGQVTAFLLVFLPALAYGVLSTQESSGAATWWGSCRHGWPLVYLERCVDPTNKGVWLLWSGVDHFVPLKLAGNIATASAVAVVVSFLWHCHTAKRRWWQFSLKETLCLVTATAVLLSYFSLPMLERRREVALAVQLERMGWALAGNEPMQAHWTMRPLLDLGVLRRDFFWRVRSVAWQGKAGESREAAPSHAGRKEAIDALMSKTGPLLARLTYCDEIRICRSALTDQGIESLCVSWRGCRRANLSNSSDLTDVALNQIVENWLSLEELDLSDTAISDKGILVLARLPRLSVLSLRHMDRTLIAGTAELVRGCAALECLEVSADWLTDPQFPRLQEQADNRGVEVIVVSE